MFLNEGTTAAVTQTPTINDIVANLPQELQAEFEKGYNIPDFIRLIKTSHPETTQLIQLLILLISSDRALIKEIDKAEGVPGSYCRIGASGIVIDVMMVL
jgi:hypothetical protein